MTSPSLSDISALQEEVIALQAESDGYEKEKKRVAEVLDKKKSALLAIMNEAKLTSFKTANGTIILNRRFQVTVPKGDDLQAFFEYLGSTDPAASTALRTVNYATLNSWFKEQLEAAGEGAPFLKIPGLAAPTANEFLSVKGSK